MVNGIVEIRGPAWWDNARRWRPVRNYLTPLISCVRSTKSDPLCQSCAASPPMDPSSVRRTASNALSSSGVHALSSRDSFSVC